MAQKKENGYPSTITDRFTSYGGLKIIKGPNKPKKSTGKSTKKK